MFGFVIGTLSLMGLAKVLRHGHHHHRWHHAYAGGCGSGGCGGYDSRDEEGGPRGYGRRGFGRRFALRWLFERLDTTPGQEKVIFAAIEEYEKVLAKHKSDWESSFEDVARALRSSDLDHTLIAEAWIKHDRAIEAFRLTTTTQLDAIHGALDERQRKILAELIESGPSWRERFGRMGGRGGGRGRYAGWRGHSYAADDRDDGDNRESYRSEREEQPRDSGPSESI